MTDETLNNFFTCVSSGSVSQNNEQLFGERKNSQCVAISVCAAAIAQFFPSDYFTGNVLDNILLEGDKYYTTSRLTHRVESIHLLGDEVDSNLKYLNRHFEVKTNLIYYSLFAQSREQCVTRVRELATFLENEFANKSNPGYIFIGNSAAVSFWKSSNEIFLFNSHSVNKFNNSVNEKIGKARLFKVFNFKGLAKLLLMDTVIDSSWPQYDIWRVHSSLKVDLKLAGRPFVLLHDVFKSPVILNTEECAPPPAKKRKIDNKQLVQDSKLLGRPFVKLDRLDENLINILCTNLEDCAPSPAKKRKVGRPKKKIGRPKTSTNKKVGRPNKDIGRPKTSTLTTKEQHRIAVAKSVAIHPDSHLRAVTKYANNNPKVNIKAVQKYKDTHIDVIINSAKKYKDTHAGGNAKAVAKYKDKYLGKHLPTPQRKGGLLAEYVGEQLDLIKLYSLKNQSLRSKDCFKCPKCGAPLFEEEKGKSQWCCGNGRYNVLNLPPLTETFYNDKKFLSDPRRYNDLFALCALDIPGKFHHPPTRPSFIKIQGRVYHKVFPLSANNLNQGSLYIYDVDAKLQRAENFATKLDPTVIRKIQRFLESTNEIFPLYKKLYDEPSDEAHLVFEATTRRTHGPVLGDRPQCSEVAAIISTDVGDKYSKKLVVWKKGENKPRTINMLHPFVEPFQYPLLYPQGTPGWEINILDNKHEKKVTQLKYVRCLLLSQDRFSKFGRLSETWLVDMYARIEFERLNFIRFNQLKGPESGGTRIGPADEILQAINNDETIQGEEKTLPGKVFLPCTFTGGPRYMRVCYFDAMAIVTRLGGPTYFLTFTAVGSWQEIIKSRYRSDNSDPSSANRVFNIKLAELIRDIKSGKWFGKFTYIIWVIEFQMRGLPHAHICFRVENGPVQSNEIDRVIRADIPSESEADGRLRALVLKHMIHGPCDDPDRKTFHCRDGDKLRCAKFFPKNHLDTTYIDDSGFVHYKRDSNNIAFIGTKTKVKVSDCWVVPYNAPLLLKYEAHINLELSSARRVVKYLFKYISKGSPLRRVAVVEGEKIDENNEVDEFVTKRYIGSSDAAWRILNFNMTGREPTVITLPIHLEGKQYVIFKTGEEQSGVDNSKSKLLIYFNRPKCPEMDNLTYQEFFENFIMHTKRPGTESVTVYEHENKNTFITPRQRKECVARLFWVPITCGELYYLRLLISKYSCRGYKDLLALGGEDCSTFQQAARALGLANNNKEYTDALREAANFMTAFRLRQFFVLLCTNGALVADLWDEFKDSLCEDFIERHPHDSELALKLGLIEIDRCLRRQGSSLREAGLPFVMDTETELGREKIRYSTSLQNEFLDIWVPKLSLDQLQVFDHIKLLIGEQSSTISRSMFLDGPGGYGKTLLLKVISAYVRSLGKIVLCVASSGIASLNLSGGTTAHSMFKIPLDFGDGTSYWSLTNRSQRAELIQEASLIIFDESPMAHKHMIEIIDRSLKDLMQNKTLFGGKIVIFAGDFRQIPPVITNAKTPSEIVTSSLRSSYIWQYLKIFNLTKAHRTGTEGDYAKFLLEIGSDRVPHCIVGEKPTNSELLVALPDIPYVDNLQSLIEFVFPQEILALSDESAKRAILCTHNKNVREINYIITQSLKGDFQNLYSIDSVSDSDRTDFHIDDALLHNAQANNVPDHILQLKVGSICLIMRNLNFDMGLVNGTKIIVEAISRRLITVRKPGGKELFGIPRISFKFPIFPNSPIEVLRRQFPLQTCYAISVHKSQGQTIDVVGLDLRSDCFTHGQLYVGLSRVRSPNDIRVLVSPDRVIEGVPYTKNVVYRDLLL